VSSLCSCGPLAYSNNEHVKHLMYALDDHVWGMKIAALEESADFATLDTEKLFSKLKSHEQSRKGHPNHDASLTSKALITSAPPLSHLFWSLPCLLWLQFLMSSTRTSLMMRLPC
jgi:hypothetical protein